MTTKRDAALAVQAAERGPAPTIVTDASGARIRTVAVHLTPFAPGCDGMAIDNPKRWATLWGVSPGSALRKTLTRLQRPPRAVALEPDAAGDVCLLARPTVAQIDRTGDDAPAPFAIFHAGLALDEAREALAALTAAGWEPVRPLSTINRETNP